MGPVTSLFIAEAFDSHRFRQLEDYIRTVGDLQLPSNAGEWHILPRNRELLPSHSAIEPCAMDIYAWNGGAAEAGATYETDAAELEQIVSATGFCPQARIQLDMGCNRAIDHLIQARIASGLLGLFHGFIDFGGALNLPADNLPAGRLTRILRPEGSCYHIGDKEFLDNWVGHPDFHLIK